MVRVGPRVGAGEAVIRGPTHVWPRPQAGVLLRQETRFEADLLDPGKPGVDVLFQTLETRVQ